MRAESSIGDVTSTTATDAATALFIAVKNVLLLLLIVIPIHIIIICSIINITAPSARIDTTAPSINVPTVSTSINFTFAIHTTPCTMDSFIRAVHVCMCMCICTNKRMRMRALIFGQLFRVWVIVGSII